MKTTLQHISGVTKTSLIVFVFFISTMMVHAQIWTWMGGSNTIGATGVYGTKGTADAANVPGARNYSARWTDASGNFWMFSGDNLANDLWKYNKSTGQWTWMSGSSTTGTAGVYGTKGTAAAANTPGGRYMSVTWTDTSGNLWLFGGSGYDGSGTSGRLNDLWKYTISTGQWTWVSGSSTQGTYGVYGTLGTASASNCPGARIDASGWMDASGNLWLFGGNIIMSNGSSINNNFWKFNVSTGEWTWMGGNNDANYGTAGTYGTKGIPAAANIPGPRSGSACWTDASGNFWMFGGSSYNDLWKYDVSTGQWTWMSGSNTASVAGVYGTLGTAAAANVPGTRASSTYWKDAAGNFWLFGGDGYGSTTTTYSKLNDLWKYNVSTGQWTWTNGSNTNEATGVYGTKGTAAAANVPGARAGSVGWVDTSGKFWLFGGTGKDGSGTSGGLNDLWMVELPAAPTSLSYSSPNEYAKNVAITNLTPTVSGTVTGYSVSPALPSGLTLNATTGVISGTPTTGSTGSYTVTASNSGGSTTFALSITVNDIVAVTATTGTTWGTYSTLKGAFDAINAGTHKGSIVIKIGGSTTESATATLYKDGYNSTSSYTDIKIYPTVIGVTISGNLTTPLIDLNGATNVTIDGRVNATGALTDLTIVNTNATTTSGNSTIRLINDAASNTVQYCRIKGSTTATTGGVVFFSTTTGTTGNSNNTISNNDITNNAGARPVNAIYALGTVLRLNSTNAITNNNIYDFLNATTTSNGINVGDYNTAWSITGNSFYETTAFSSTTSSLNYKVINITSPSGAGFTVSNNYIGGKAAQCGSTAWTKTGATDYINFYAVYISTGTGTASSVQGNTISNFNWTNTTTTSTNWYGIYTAGTGDVNIGSTTGNVIGSAIGNGSVLFTTSYNSSVFYGINIQNTGTSNVSNNTIGSITVANSGATYATNFWGIYKFNNGGTTAITNNTIGSTDGSTTNSIYASSAATGSSIAQAVTGIESVGTGTVTISGNTISKMTNGTTNSSAGSGSIIGIRAGNGTNTTSNNTVRDLTIGGAICQVTGISISNGAATAQLVSGNTIYNLSNTYATFTSNVVGLNYGGSTTASTVSGNFIHSLSVTGASSTTAKIYGINITSGATTYANNIVSLGGNTKTTLYGIYEAGVASNNNNLYYNTIYIGGSLASGSTNQSFALYSSGGANSRDFKNNVLYNARSTVSGNNLHYAFYLSSDGALVQADYNDYYVSGTGGTLGYGGGGNRTALPIATGKDANSAVGNPNLVNPSGTSAADYQAQNTSLFASTATGVTTDYAGTTRNATSPSMGAYDYALTASVTVTATAGTTTGAYPNLYQAFSKINDGTHKGDISIAISNSTSEPYTATLYQTGYNSTSSYTSVSVYPTATGLTIGGNLNAPLIDLNGATNATIDGRLNKTGTDKDLTISNQSTATSASTIRFINDASTNTVKYCTIKGSSSNASGGVLFFSTASANGNNNNVIDNNNITNASDTYRPLNALYAYGTSGKMNSNNTVSNNNIYDFFARSTASYGIYLYYYNSAWTITNNSFYETASFGPGASVEYDAIYINNSGGSGFTVTNNKIGGSANNCGGLPWTKTNAFGNVFCGLRLGLDATSTIQGNVVKNFNWTNSTNANWYGISSGGGTITNNTIGATSGNGSITVINGASGGYVYGIYSTAGTVQNNTVGSITTNNSNSTYSTNIYGIYGLGDVMNNTVGSTDAGTTNSIYAASVASSNSQGVYGIQSGNSISGNVVSKINNAGTYQTNTYGIYAPTSSLNKSISGNTIHDVTDASSYNGQSPAGLYISTSSIGTLVTGNTIYAISNTNPAFGGLTTGLYYQGPTSGINTVSANVIYGLSTDAAASSAKVSGITVGTGLTTYQNNIISLTGNMPATVYGIWDNTNSGGTNLYFNTVYLAGQPTTGAAPSYAFYSAYSGTTRNYQDNIFYNARSNNGATGTHYAAYFNYTANTSLTLNYNDYYAPGTGGVLGRYNSLDVTALPLVTGNDANSVTVNPTLANAGGTTAADYFPGVNLVGGTGTGALFDYYNNVRSAAAPKMGSLEYANIVSAGSNTVDVYTGGTFQASYADITAAFAKVNDGTHTGSIVMKLTANETLTAMAVLNASGTNGASYTDISIYPTSTGLSIMGNLNAPLIDLNGADNVTIDGRLNAAGSAVDLSLINTSTSSTATTSAIRFINDAQTNTVKYCNIKSSTADAFGGIIFFSTTTGSTGNSNNTIDHNNITNYLDGFRPINAFYSNGTAAKVNSGITISNNAIYNFLNRGIASFGVYLNSNTTACTVTGNSFYETTSFVPTASVDYAVIKIYNTSGVNFTVSNNYIGGSDVQCGGGTPWTKTSAFNNNFTGIDIAAGIGTASTIQGNTIKNFNYANSLNGSWYAINANSSNVADLNIGTTTGNVIGAPTGNGSIIITNSTSGGTVTAINAYGASIKNVQNNTVGAVTVANSNALYGISNFYGLSINGTNLTVSNNTIGSTDAGTTNSIIASSASTNSTQSVQGIYISGTGTVSISGNTVAKLTNASTYTGGGVTGINTGGSGSNTITNNTIRDLGTSDIAGNPSITGLQLQNTSAVQQTITGNNIYSLSNTYSGFTGKIVGLYYNGGTTASAVTNNLINGLSVNATNAATLYGIQISAGNTTYANNIVAIQSNTPSTIYGIYETGTSGNNNNLYHNTISLSGTVPSGSAISYALYSSSSSNVRNFRNNIFSNTRTNSGATGTHYAAYFNYGVSTNLTLNYNDYFVNGTGGVAFYSTAGLTGTNSNSVTLNPQSANTGGTSAVDYLPSNGYLLGVTGTSITTDYTNTTRSATAPAMGAYDYPVTAPPGNVSVSDGTNSGEYQSLNAAFAAINGGGYTGAITVQVKGNTTEFSTAVLNASGGYTSVNVYPTVSGLSITGNLPGAPLINLNGASNVTIDGRLNASGSSKELSIINTIADNAPTTATIQFINGASNNTVKYCTIKGSTTSSTTGTLLFSTSTGTTGNSSNTIDHNDITCATDAGRPVNVIYSVGTSGNVNTGNIISNNNIYNFFHRAPTSSYSYCINLNNYTSDWSITGNSFYETASFTPTNTASYSVIYINNTSGVNFNVSNNYIGGSAANCGGSPWTKTVGTSGNSFQAINMYVGTTTTSSVHGNTIANFDFSNSSGNDWYGISVAAGNVNIGTTTGNTIGAATGNGLIKLTNGGANGSLCSIYTSSAGAVNIANNTIGSLTAANTVSTASTNLYGIWRQGSGTSSITNNTVGSTDSGTSNSLTATSASSSSVQKVYGIYNAGAGTLSISGNTVSKVTNSATVTLSPTAGICMASGSATINNNTIRDLTTASAPSSLDYTASMVGIAIGGSGSVVSGNTVYNLTNTNTSSSGNVFGIFTSASSTVTGNYVHDLFTSATGIYMGGIGLGAGTTTCANNVVSLINDIPNIFLWGIYDAGAGGARINVYHNTVYIGGNDAGGSLIYSAAFCSWMTPTNYRKVYNNVFVNARSTPAGSNRHLGAMFNYTVNNSYLELDYNNYYVSGTGGILGFSNVANRTSLPIVPGFDTHSTTTNLTFANAAGTAAADYAFSETLAGTQGTGIMTDYLQNVRSISAPKSGAFEYSTVQPAPATTVDAYVGGTLQTSYVDLKAAFDAINLGTHTGSIILKVTASQILSSAAVLNASGGSSSYTDITIYPTVSGLSIAGNLATPVIDLNGAKNVTIDGRVNAVGTDMNMLIYNASTASTAGTSTIRFINEASTNTIKYCNIKGSTADISSGIIFFSTTTGTTGNNNNIIDHNRITNGGGMSRPISAVYSYGTASKANTGGVISNNTIYDYLNRGTLSYGIYLSTNTSGWTITDNSFYETTSFVPTASVAYSAIYIDNASGINFTVTNNYIGGSAANCSGSAWTKSNAFDNTFTGIYINVATGTASSVQGNTIKNFAWSNSSSASWYAMNIYAGDVNVGTVTGNTIGAQTGNGSITVTDAGSSGVLYGINIQSAGSVSVQNNTIGAITTACSASTAPMSFCGINKSASAGTVTISGNTIGSTDEGTSNSINATSASTGSAQTVVGINSAGNGTVLISGNTVAKLTNSSTSTGVNTYGYTIGILTTAGTNTISNNIVRDLKISNANTGSTYQQSIVGIVQNSTTASAQSITGNTIYNLTNDYVSFAGNIIGLYYNGSITVSTVSGNFIYGLNTTGTSSTTASIYGIKINAGATTYANNIITLGGNTLTTLYGIYETGTSGNNNSLFFNTVYIAGGLASGAVNKSYALYSATNSNTRNFRNNIFSNVRSTTGGSNLHYAAYFVPTTVGSLTLNYNDYYVSGTGGTLGYFNSVNLTSIPLISGSDANSLTLNPSFANPGGTAAADYKPSAKLDGLTGTGITTDFIGTTRGTTPTMGAYDILQSVWTGATSTDWNDATNWTPNVVPTSAVDVVVGSVTNTPTVGDNSICKSLKINTGGVITIPAGKSLTVMGSITNSGGAASIIVKSSATLPNGTLIFNNAQNAPVQATVEMYSKASWNLMSTTGNKYKWQFFGVPVRTLVASPTLDGGIIRRYDESQTTSNWFALSSSSTLDPFTGYEVVQESGKTYTYTGDLVNADYSLTLTKTSGAVNAGNHLFANPYTAAIDITKLNFGTQADATVYLYNTGTVNDWASYTGVTDGSNPGQYTAAPKATAGVGGIPAQVPSMQGFVVKALSSDVNATFGIPYSAVVVKNAEQQRVKSTDTSSDKVYTIVDVVGTTGGDRMWLFTDAGCSHSFDNGWDGRKMLGSALIPQLYASEADGDYQVNSVNDVNNTELAFQAGTDSNYKLRFTHNNVQAVYNKLYLLDKVTGTTTDITISGTEYSFTASTDVTSTNRFKIVATIGSTTGVNTPTEDAKVTVFSSKNTIFVQNSTSDKGDLMLYDIAGRYLQKIPFNPSSITATPMGLVPGVYVAKAMINNKVMVTKNLIIQ